MSVGVGSSRLREAPVRPEPVASASPTAARRHCTSAGLLRTVVARDRDLWHDIVHCATRLCM